MRKVHLLGLDLGGTKIAAGVVDSTGRMLSGVRVPTPAVGVKRDLAAMFDAAQAAVRSAKIAWSKIRAVGVGVPGAFDPVTETVWAPNLPGWTRTPLKRLLEESLSRPVFVEGDRNVQALAEAWRGVGRRGQIRNLIFLTVGTGIGAGLIIDGKVVSGTRGLAGAAGWLVVSDKWQATFARTGCLESQAAGPAVARLARKALRKNPRSLIKALAEAHGGRLSGEIVTEAARLHDPVACEILAEIGETLGRGVANMVSLLNPQAVVLGGGLGGASELILDSLRCALRQWGQPLGAKQVRVVRSRLGEEAGILGAARYALAASCAPLGGYQSGRAKNPRSMLFN